MEIAVEHHFFAAIQGGHVLPAVVGVPRLNLSAVPGDGPMFFHMHMNGMGPAPAAVYEGPDFPPVSLWKPDGV